MVLKLRELLIKDAALHLLLLASESFHRLTADQRERILRWLVLHDRLTNEVIPCVTQHLLSVPLHSLEFYKCDQLTNDMLVEIGKAMTLKRLKSLIVHQCKQVQGN